MVVKVEIGSLGCADAESEAAAVRVKTIACVREQCKQHLLCSLQSNATLSDTLFPHPSTLSISLDGMKVTIKEWNAVASWRWDMPEDEVCGICRVQFDGTCPTCKFPGDDCSLCMSPVARITIRRRTRN